MPTGKVLIVEDDKTLLSVLQYNIAKEGYDTLTASDGIQALEAARARRPDLIVLDVMLPGMSGLEVCRILRQEMTVPILMLTARVEETDKVAGLDSGADDYMTKPFSTRELLARVRAILRRASMPGPRPGEGTVVRAGDIEIDTARHTATVAGRPVDLTPKEFDLITFLAKNTGLVFSREQLLERVWGYDYAGDTGTIDVHVRWLREKIEDSPSKPRRLLTVRGVGYKLES